MAEVKIGDRFEDCMNPYSGVYEVKRKLRGKKFLCEVVIKGEDDLIGEETRRTFDERSVKYGRDNFEQTLALYKKTGQLWRYGLEDVKE